MEDLSFLREVVPAGARGLDKGAPELSALAQLAEDRKASELMRASRELMASGIHDVRIVAHYLWGAVLAHGLPQLGPVLETLAALARAKFTGFGPEDQRDVHAAKRIAWLLKSCHDELTYHQTKETAAWSRWPEADATAALAGLALLASALDGELALALPPLTELTSRLRAVQQRLAQAAVRTSEASGTAAAPEPGASTQDPPATALTSHHSPGIPGQVALNASASFFALVERMQAFATLIERGELARAAVVGDDLTRTIENFDPRQYFPELFSEFSRLLSEHIDVLALAWEERETIAWKARAQFYQVDLKRFVAGS